MRYVYRVLDMYYAFIMYIVYTICIMLSSLLCVLNIYYAFIIIMCTQYNDYAFFVIMYT